MNAEQSEKGPRQTKSNLLIKIKIESLALQSSETLQSKAV